MIGAYSHELSSWKAYPRAHHYQKRFKDVYARLEPVTSKWPYSPKLTENIQDRACKIENDLRLVVIGRENVNAEKLVISTQSLKGDRARGSTVSPIKLSSDLQQKNQFTVVICYEKIKDFTDGSLQKVLGTLKYLDSHAKSFRSSVVGPLVVCETNGATEGIDSKRKIFCEEIKSLALKETPNISIDDENIMSIDDENIMIVDVKDSSEISRRISDIIERELMKDFHGLMMHLRDIIGDRYFDACELDIIESDQLITAMQGFLKNGLGFVDMLESNNDQMSFIEIMLTKFTEIIRCAVMAPLAGKYCLSQDECNELAHQFEFDIKMKESISRNARYHLSKMETPCKDMLNATKAGNKHCYFPGKNFAFIAYVVRDDIKKVFQTFEDLLNSTRRVGVTMRKMLFEIDGYIKSSKMKHGFDLIPSQTEIPRELKEAVVGTDGVYGIGTIYGRVEIHLENLATHKVMEIKEQICEIIKKFKFFKPYRVDIVLKKPQPFCLDTGTSIGCECPTDDFRFRGTLGGLVRNEDGEIYVLTCAHVVHAEHDAIHNVFDGNRRVFAVSQPETKIPPERGTLIDIAAVKVIHEKDKMRCRTNLKDEDGNYMRTELYMGFAQELIESERRVYKHGAGSQFTDGLVCSSDYSRANRDVTHQELLIETMPGCEDNSYACEGDSGSIICMSDVGAQHVTAVSMLAEGEFGFTDDNYCTSFLLREGIDSLNAAGNLQLHFPSD